MFLSYFLSHFTTLNLLFYDLYLIMLMPEINVDTLQLSAGFQSLTRSALFPICGFVIFFFKVYARFFVLQRRCVSFCWVPEAWPTLTSTDNSIFHLRFFKPPIQCGFRLQTYVRALRYMTSCVRIFPLHSESRIETANILCYLLGLFLRHPYSEGIVLWGPNLM